MKKYLLDTSIVAIKNKCDINVTFVVINVDSQSGNI